MGRGGCDFSDKLFCKDENADLIAIGAYKSGTNAKVDYAISKIDKINGFLKQSTTDKFFYDEVVAEMEKILK